MGSIWDDMEARGQKTVARQAKRDSTRAVPARPDSTSVQPVAPAPSNNNWLGSTLMQAGADINSMLPVIGGTLGAALGTPADILSGPGGTIAGGLLGAAAGRAAQQALNPLFGEKPPADPMQAYGQQAMSAATSGALPVMTEMGVNAAAPHVAKAVAQTSIAQGWGNPVEMAETMLRYGINNSKGGVRRVIALLDGLSSKHNERLMEVVRNERPTWNAIQDYMTPALSPIRRQLLNANLPEDAMNALYETVGSFVRSHGIPVNPRVWLFGNPARAAAQGTVRRATSVLTSMGEKDLPVTAEHAAFLNPTERVGLGYSPGGIRDRTIGLYQLNALKEDADRGLRKLWEARRTMSTEVPPDMDMRMKALEALGNRARVLMYGEVNPATGLREGGVASHLWPLDKEQHLLLNLKSAIGPAARKGMTVQARAAEAAARTGPAMVLSQALPGDVAARTGHAVVAGGVGAAATNPTVLSVLAQALNSPNMGGFSGNLVRYLEQVYDTTSQHRTP